jgi:amino acid transporter
MVVADWPASFCVLSSKRQARLAAKRAARPRPRDAPVPDSAPAPSPIHCPAPVPSVPTCPSQDGYFVNVGKQVSAGLGYWMVVSAVIACFNGFNARIAGTARAVQACANLRMLPELLSWNVRPWATPVPAILLQGAITMIFINFSFASLVVLGAWPGVSVWVWVCVGRG